jgi:hypothetical protein
VPALEVNGHEVEVDDSFLSMSREQQDTTVDEIALSLSRQGANGQRVDPGHGNVPEFVPPGVENYNPDTGEVGPHDMGAAGTFMASGAEGVPIIGGLLDKGVLNASAGIGSVISGRPFSQVQSEMADMRDHSREAHPVARLAGNVTGGIVSMAPIAATSLGGQALGMTGRTLGTRTLASGLSSGGVAGADTLARGGSLEDAGKSALIGGGVGAAFPALGRLVSQGGSAAAKAAAPTIDALKQNSRELYQNAFNAGVALKPQAFDRALHPNTAAVIKRLGEARGKPLGLQELDNLRRIASNAQGGINRSDSAAAQHVIDGIDGLIDSPANFTLGHSGSLPGPGINPNPSAGLQALQEARQTWHTVRKSETIDELFRRAEIKSGSNKGEDYAKALEREFKALALRKNGLRGFSTAEKRLVEKIAKGVDSPELMVKAGRLLRSMPAHGIAASLGFGVGGPLGGAAGVTATSLLGGGLERVATGVGARRTINAAERAAASVRSGGRLGGQNYAPNVVTPLERSLKALPFLTHDRQRGGR